MLVVNGNNIGQAFKHGLGVLLANGEAGDSRNGMVLRVPKPVSTVYSDPIKRALWNPVRRPNPFFHVMESMWMLAGRKDLKFPSYFNARMVEYSDDGGATQPAAYGHRWVNHFDIDQINFVVDELLRDPKSRRAVISMWDVNTDAPAVYEGTNDVPCNTTIYFIKRSNGRLDMTVSCRSNDAIWGCYGANAVHLSFLHEYVSLAAEIQMGTYTQISNDLHVYLGIYDEIKMDAMRNSQEVCYPWEVKSLWTYYESRDQFDEDLDQFFRHIDSLDDYGDHEFEPGTFHTEWFEEVIVPMFVAWDRYKSNDLPHALEIVDKCLMAEDWQSCCREWLKSSSKNK